MACRYICMKIMRRNMVDLGTDVRIRTETNKEMLEDEQAHRRRIVTRLARIEGQVRGIQSMITENRPCEQIALQLTAARRALDKAFYEMIACSLMTNIDASADMDEVRLSTQKMATLLAKFG